MNNNGKKFFLVSFSLTVSLGLVFLSLILQPAGAADVNVNANVATGQDCGNGLVEGTETCDDGNERNEECSDGTVQTEDTCNATCTGFISHSEECESSSGCEGGAECVSCVCGSICFVEGTEITLADGGKIAIEDIEVDDVVLSYDQNTQELEPATVAKTYEHQTDQYLIFNYEIEVTATHPLFVNGDWVKAGDIEIGDKLFNEAGEEVEVFSIQTKAGEEVNVYTLTVDNNHNYFAEEILAHNKGEGECSPVCNGRVCGPSNCPGINCGTCGPNQTCAGGACVDAPYCGDSIINQPTEECDDGPSGSDTCTTDCKLKSLCGNGEIDPPEQCDEQSQCCSGSCTILLLIDSVSPSATDTTITIDWETPCQASSSLLEWGTTTAVDEGSVSGLTGQNYSQSVTQLIPNTVYFFRITADAGVLQAISTGSVLTTGGVEDCTNGIDDDNDGLIDIEDPDCPCEAEWECIPADWNDVECIDNQKTRTCEKVNNCWSNEPEEDTTIGCGLCEGVICPPNYEIIDCDCVPIVGECGNGTCEPPDEDPFTCRIDCPVDCLSEWQCDPWVPEICPASGIQARDCWQQCPIPINQPPVTRDCSNQCPGLSCRIDQRINLEECICDDIIPYCGNGVCEAGENNVICPADCIDPCVPDWNPTPWGECINGTQTREVVDLENCNLDLDKPPTVRSCTEGCDVACSTCQQIDVNSCSCTDIALCCGNAACEVNEKVWSCAVDCGLPPDFRLALTDCLDGLDNDNDGFVDYPADPGCTSPSDLSELNFAEVIENIQDFITNQILDNETVEEANESIATPLLITTVTVNTFATFSFFNFFSYLQFLVTQPFAALFRRKRRKWGTVYNSLSKQVIDLAIVRLYQKENSRLVQSRVTDKLGRFSFLASPGRYYITVTKSKFAFPTEYLKDKTEDAKYLDLYHGETIEVTEERADITVNIPLDPEVEEKPVTKVIFQHYLRKVQFVASFAAVPLATISMVISPGALTFTMFGFHCLLFVLFRRLGYQKPPKNWGIIYDKGNKKPLGRAITRIYDKQYNKLLETRVTDGRGRYSFLVNNNTYFVTAEKLGYKKFKTDEIDLVKKDLETVVGMDIGLEKGQGEAPAPAAPTQAPAQPPAQTPPAGKVGLPAQPASSPPVPTPTTPPPAKPAESKVDDELTLLDKVQDLVVSKDSLKDLLKTKQDVQEAKKEIDEKQLELDKLEDKVEDIEESIDDKLDKLNGETDIKTDQPSNETQVVQDKPDEATKSTKKEQPSSTDEKVDEEPKPSDDKSDDKPDQPSSKKSIFG
ncbi:MAG: hypothetical protein CMI53_03735 [Parcubacteria group bacterium]|nr:hypothetical protein [Parcubacteria group bacterium]